MKASSLIPALAVSLLLVTAGSAAAGNVCLADDSSGKYIFSKLKLPKKPGTATTLQGVRIQGGLGPFPFTGAATMTTGGSLHVAIVVHPYAAFSNELAMGWIPTDSTLAGTAFYDSDADGYKDNGDLILTSVDCDTVVVP
jgi:hypothetical protein